MPDSGLTEMYPMDLSDKQMDRRHGCGIATSVRYLRASSLSLMVFHRRYCVTLSSLAHAKKSSASVTLNGRIESSDEFAISG